MSEKDNSRELPDISGLFDIDENLIPDEIIEKDPDSTVITSPILTSEEAMRKLPKEARKDIESDNKARKKRAAAKKRKSKLTKTVIAVIAVILGISLINFIIDRTKMPSVSVEKPVIQTLYQYYDSTAVTVKQGESILVAFVDNDYDLHFIEKGQDVVLTLSDGTKTSGKVTDIKAEQPESRLISMNFTVLTGTLPSTSVYAVYITPDDNSVFNGEGIVLTAKVITKTAENALTLPDTAVIKSENGYYVWLYSSFRNCLNKVDVTVGISVDGKTEITSGIEKSDRAAVSFSCLPEQLYEDIKVKTN